MTNRAHDAIRPLLCALIMLCGAHGAAAAPSSRYVAVFADGTRLEGDAISAWHSHTETPRLDGTSLAQRNRPLRWLRDTTLSAWQPTGEYIELFGGDRLPGKVVGFTPGRAGHGGNPATLSVEPAIALGHPTSTAHEPIRVLADEVSRVVFEASARRRPQPATLFCRDGRELKFRGRSRY